MQPLLNFTIKRSILAVLTSLVFSFLITVPSYSAAVSNNTDLHGLWIESHKRKTAVWIEDCEEYLCGYIYWLKNPLSKTGKTKTDQHNPDINLRQRPRCGLKILSGFSRVKKNKWKAGKIYNPGNGKSYRSIIRLKRDGTLKVRAYIGIPLFGKTLRWERSTEKIPRCH